MITSAPPHRAQGACPANARTPTCHHLPPCPVATAPDRDAARTVAAHPEQGWSLLCNGVVLFDDTGELLPDGSALPPRRASCGLVHREAAQRRPTRPAVEDSSAAQRLAARSASRISPR